MGDEQMIDFFGPYGYWGMGLAAFLSGTVFPAPSELLLVYMISEKFNVFWLTLAATIGNTLAGVTCFYSGYLAKKEKVMAFFRISDKKMRRADRLIGKYGLWTAFFSFLPAIGEVLLIALGFMRADKTKVFVYMTLGKLLRYSMIAISTVGIARYFGF